MWFIRALKDSAVNLSATGNFIDEARRKLNLFTSIEFAHVKRDGNEIAHLLAQEVEDDGDDGFGDLPF